MCIRDRWCAAAAGVARRRGDDRARSSGWCASSGAVRRPRRGPRGRSLRSSARSEGVSLEWIILGLGREPAAAAAAPAAAAVGDFVVTFDWTRFSFSADRPRRGRQGKVEFGDDGLTGRLSVGIRVGKRSRQCHSFTSDRTAHSGDCSQPLPPQQGHSLGVQVGRGCGVGAESGFKPHRLGICISNQILYLRLHGSNRSEPIAPFSSLFFAFLLLFFTVCWGTSDFATSLHLRCANSTMHGGTTCSWPFGGPRDGRRGREADTGVAVVAARRGRAAKKKKGLSGFRRALH